jgi:integrase
MVNREGKEAGQNKKGPGLTVDSFLEILRSMQPERDRILVRVLFETGCSIQELANIKVKDHMPAKDHTTLPAITFGIRKSAISSELSSQLTKLTASRNRNKDEYLFSQKPSKPFSVKRIEQIFESSFSDAAQRLFKKNKISKKIRTKPYDIRYLHIIHAITKGLTIDSISAQTGISRQRITQLLDELKLSNIQSYTSFFEDKNTYSNRRET